MAQVEISERDEHGGVWVNVTGDERDGDNFNNAAAKAAGAIRKYARENGLGRANRVSSGGSFEGNRFEYAARYHFGDSLPEVVLDQVNDTRDFDAAISDVVDTVSEIERNAALLVVDQRTAQERADRHSSQARTFYDRYSAGVASVPPEEWATDELANIIRDAESRCQAQPIHRMSGRKAEGVVELPNGNQVPACAQCIDYYGRAGDAL